jgi:methyltransferase
VFGHTAVIGGTLLFGSLLQPGWFLALLADQPLRAWTLSTLGHRWNARGAVPVSVAVATDGPYAYVRHPNYSVIVVELLALPMAFGLPRLALGASAFNACLLALRIHDEERLLFELPGYREHFGRRPRFLPGLF